MMSLRRMIFFWLAALLGLVGVAASLTSYLLVRSESAAFLDNQLRQIASYVGDAVPLNASAITPPHDTEDDFVIKVRFKDGRPERNSNAGMAIPEQTTTGFSRFADKADEWRLFTLIGADRTTQVAQQMSVRKELATNAALQVSLPIALTIPLSWLVMHFIVGRIVGRLDAVAAVVERREAADASPIPTADVPTEVLPLVQAINDLLARLLTAMQRQRRFVADASHELRTPLGALVIQIDNLGRLVTDGPLTERLAELEKGARRAATLTSQLLRLASYDAADIPVPVDRLQVDAIALEAVEQLIPLATERSVDLGVTRCEPMAVQGSRVDYRVLIENILDNAIRYTPAEGSVDLAVYAVGPVAIVEVKDTGPGIPQEKMSEVFERFVRAAPQDIEGSGLGLPIAKAIAERYGVEITLANRRDRSGLVVKLAFALSGHAAIGSASAATVGTTLS